MIDVPVLIVGGGPVGLTASIYLSLFGIESLTIERHPGTAILPKARAINARTMEMYRQLGLEPEIQSLAMPKRFGGAIIWSESLAGQEIKRLTPGRGAAGNLALSAAAHCGCSQDIFEPVLRRRAEAAGADRVRFGTELLTLDTSSGEVRATIRGADGREDREEEVLARYLIAADGAHSKIRNQLDIPRQGQRDVYDSVNIHFRADLTRYVDDRPAALYLIEQPELRGTFLTINGSDRWAFLVTSLSQYGFTAEQFTPAFSTEVIRRAAGVPDLEVQVLGVGDWRASALVAERYRAGPVFLAGDAAHEMPPTGGFGMNTGVQDAQNLAWKLAAVLHGEAGDALLDSYDAERKPVGQAVTQSSLLNALSMGRTERQAEAVLPRKEFLNEIGLVFGAHYRSSAVVADDTTASAEAQVEQYLPSATPGGRAPHVWLSRGEQRLSTIDLFGRGFVLLTAPGGAAWREAASRLASPRIDCPVIGEALQDLCETATSWQAAYGIDDDGAVLVRPDGHVGWRAHAGAADAEVELRQALDAILSRGPQDDGGRS